MLSYEEALERILTSVSGPLPGEEIAITDALGRTLAAEIVAETDLPPFDNSAVDGYAVDGSIKALPTVREGFPLNRHIPAGTVDVPPLSLGEIAYIATGAPIPDGADRVIMVEDTEHLDLNFIYFKENGRPGGNIRRRGSDVVKGTTILRSGAVLGPGEIGLLASLNHPTIYSPRLPLVGILSTGDELIPVGKADLKSGQIRDSNGPAIASAVLSAGGITVGRHHARDTKESVRYALEALQGSDVIIASGGVSVGEYDVVKDVFREMGELDFWRIAIKPGKPLAFGKIGDALFFGLPGNPVSSLVTFELFVRPVLRKLMGFKNVLRPQVTAVLTAPLSHEPGRREFVRASLEWKGHTYHATPTGAQGSHRLSSLLGADALLVAHEDHGDYGAGAVLPAMLLTG